MPGRGGWPSGPFRADFVPYKVQKECPEGTTSYGVHCNRNARGSYFHLSCQPDASMMRHESGNWRLAPRVIVKDRCPHGYSCKPHEPNQADVPGTSSPEDDPWAKLAKLGKWTPDSADGRPMPSIDCVPWRTVISFRTKDGRARARGKRPHRTTRRARIARTPAAVTNNAAPAADLGVEEDDNTDIASASVNEHAPNDNDAAEPVDQVSLHRSWQFGWVPGPLDPAADPTYPGP